MTKIEWTNKTWNPIIGCSKISEGCKNCYAERMAKILAGIKHTGYYGNALRMHPFDLECGQWDGTTHFVNSALEKPFHWKKPQMIFVCSMGDLFHESVPFEWILKVWDVMCENPRHTFQILTKRPERMLEFYKWLGQKCKDDGLDSVPSESNNLLNYIDTPNNIWIGVTVENQKMADKRIPILLNVPVKVRFVSCEPLLGKVSKFIMDIEANNLIDWVITGPETGPGKRPMKKEWIESLYNQCKAANIPFFDKKDTLGLNLKQFPIK
jgi:protein gp37